MAHFESEFTFDGMPVGYFEGTLPRSPGRYPYMPYRGSGHYEMHTLRRAGGKPQCFYESGGERVGFTVDGCPGYGVLELSQFVFDSPRVA